MLYHRPQTRLYGCLYHSLYALTGDEHWLEHVEDVSRPRWHARLHAAGLMVMAYWDAELIEQSCPPELWARLREWGQGQEGFTHIPMLATIHGIRAGHHIVGLALPVGDGPVWVSDSARHELQTLTLEEFLSSPYASAYAVEALAPADLNVYPPDPGHLHFAEPSTDYAM